MGRKVLEEYTMSYLLRSKPFKIVEALCWHLDLKFEHKYGLQHHLTIIYDLSVCMYVYSLSPSRRFSLSGLDFQKVMGVIVGWL